MKKKKIDPLLDYYDSASSANEALIEATKTMDDQNYDFEVREKTLSYLWHIQGKLTDQEEELLSELNNPEKSFVKFLRAQGLQVVPNVAQRSGSRFLIVDNELKKTWAGGVKHVDGWLYLGKKWIPYDVKSHETSCLGFTFEELSEYKSAHHNVLFVIYDKGEEKNVPKILFSLKNLLENQVFTGPIEDFKSDSNNNEKTKRVTGEGVIIPIASEYALYKTQSFLWKETRYECPQFNSDKVRIMAKTNDFTQILNEFFDLDL